MNAPLHPPMHPEVETRAPYRFNLDELLRIVEAGLLDDDHVELIDGELIYVSPETLPHARVKRWLTTYFNAVLLGQGYEIAPDSTLKLDKFTAPEPDVYIFPSAVSDETMTGADLSLVIEVAVTSLLKDLRRKSRVYARHGVAEYWVVDVDARRIWVHRDPQGQAYASVSSFEADQRVTPLRLPQVAFGFCDLPG